MLPSSSLPQVGLVRHCCCSAEDSSLPYLASCRAHHSGSICLTLHCLTGDLAGHHTLPCLTSTKHHLLPCLAQVSAGAALCLTSRGTWLGAVLCLACSRLSQAPPSALPHYGLVLPSILLCIMQGIPGHCRLLCLASHGFQLGRGLVLLWPGADLCLASICTGLCWTGHCPLPCLLRGMARHCPLFPPSHTGLGWVPPSASTCMGFGLVRCNLCFALPHTRLG